MEKLLECAFAKLTPPGVSVAFCEIDEGTLCNH